MDLEPDITKPPRRAHYEPDADPGENAMFWFNIVGFSIASFLLGWFFLFYGVPFLGLVVMLFRANVG